MPRNLTEGASVARSLPGTDARDSGRSRHQRGARRWGVATSITGLTAGFRSLSLLITSASMWLVGYMVGSLVVWVLLISIVRNQRMRAHREPVPMFLD
jgi:hypothetical protein